MFALTDAQRDLQARARDLARGEIAARAAETDRTEAYPWYAVEALRGAGFMGLTIPAAYGGGGGTLLDAVLVIEQLAQVCGATGRIAVESNMGAVGAIMAYGTEAQRRLAAELVLGGDKPAICITEPEAGSASTMMATRAERRGDRYVLHGRKHWITGGGVSKLHLIFARVVERGAEQGIGAFIAVRGSAGAEGLVVGRREPAMGIRGIPEAEIVLDGLEVPEAMALRPPGGWRRSFGALMRAYNAQRVGAATVALGIAEGAWRLALGYANERHQFGRPIAEFQGLQWMLADMSTQLAAARALVYGAAAGADRNGFPEVAAAARAKLFASEMAVKVTNDALQIFGARGYSREQPLERMVRDARMFTISGGTAQILRNQIAAHVLGRKLPQGRGGSSAARAGDIARAAAE